MPLLGILSEGVKLDPVMAPPLPPLQQGTGPRGPVGGARRRLSKGCLRDPRPLGEV